MTPHSAFSELLRDIRNGALNLERSFKSFFINFWPRLTAITRKEAIIANGSYLNNEPNRSATTTIPMGLNDSFGDWQGHCLQQCSWWGCPGQN